MLTPITKEDLEKYDLAICLIKMSMTPGQFEKWYGEELVRREVRAKTRKEKEKEENR
jgi:hypothetical protein